MRLNLDKYCYLIVGGGVSRSDRESINSTHVTIEGGECGLVQNCTSSHANLFSICATVYDQLMGLAVRL